MVSVAPVAPMPLAVRVGAVGVPVTVSDQAPSPVVFTAATRTVYCVLLVRFEIVAEVVVEVVWRVVDQSCNPDFHWIL